MLSHTYSNTISENLELPDWGDLNESDLDIELKMNGKFLHNRSIAQFTSDTKRQWVANTDTLQSPIHNQTLG